jgi:hypothetical protein
VRDQSGTLPPKGRLSSHCSYLVGIMLGGALLVLIFANSPLGRGFPLPGFLFLGLGLTVLGLYAWHRCRRLYERVLESVRTLSEERKHAVNHVGRRARKMMR